MSDTPRLRLESAVERILGAIERAAVGIVGRTKTRLRAAMATRAIQDVSRGLCRHAGFVGVDRDEHAAVVDAIGVIAGIGFVDAMVAEQAGKPARSRADRSRPCARLRS